MSTLRPAPLQPARGRPVLVQMLPDRTRRTPRFERLGSIGLLLALATPGGCGEEGSSPAERATDGTETEGDSSSTTAKTSDDGQTEGTSDATTQGEDSGDSEDATSTSTSGTAGDATTADPGSTGDDSGDPTGDPVLPPTSPGCGSPLSGQWLSPYQLEWGALTEATQVQVSGVNRDYIVVLPPNYDPDTAYPVHIVFHAWTGDMDNAYGQRVENRWGEPVIAIAPQGQPVQGGGYGWEWWETDSIDYAFIDAMIQDIGANACVDNRRIFASGVSNGAYMAEMVACLRGYIRGVSGSAGGMQAPAAACAGPVTAFLIHGSADTVVPIAEGVAARDRWLEVNGCSDVSASAVDGRCQRYSDCDSGEEVYWCQHTGGHPEASPNSLGLSEPMISLFESL